MKMYEATTDIMKTIPTKPAPASKTGAGEYRPRFERKKLPAPISMAFLAGGSKTTINE